MTTATPPRPAHAAARPPAPTPPSALATPALDPAKLFARYWKVLAAAGVAGIGLGLAAHFVLLVAYPIYRAEALFECKPPFAIDKLTSETRPDDEEMSMFMATQTAIMLSDGVLERATKNPNFTAEAPKWSGWFIKNGVFSYREAALELKDDLRTRVEPGTYLIRLSLGYRDKEEVTAIVRLVRQAYLEHMATSGNLDSLDLKNSLGRAINELNNTVNELQSRRDKRLAGENADSLDARESEARTALAQANYEQLRVQTELQQARVQFNDLTSDLRNVGSPTYTDRFRQEVEGDPMIQRLKAMIDDLNGRLQTLRERGIGPENRAHKDIIAAIAGTTSTLETTRQKLLIERYNAVLDGLRLYITTLEAQEVELAKQVREHRDRLNVLTRLTAEIRDIDTAIDRAMDQVAAYESEIKLTDARTRLRSSARIQVVQSEQIPNEVSFPEIFIMVPAGFLLSLALVGGIIVLREVLDQRIKSPSDVSLIPRTRVVGMIPHAGEDPSSPENAESAFITQPSGVLAESFRQVRASVSERMRAGRHKSLLIVSAAPGSGGSSVAANLAVAAAAADQRVLIIDANFRRPNQHRIFNLGETPGLAEVLASAMTIDEAAQDPGIENLSVLTCGSPTVRHFERLATDKMTAVIAEASSKFDLVLIDCAPAIVSGDASALTARCDASMLVVMAYNEKRGLVNRLKNELSDQRAEFLGVLVNGVRSTSGGYMKRNLRATHEYHNAKA